MTFSCAEARLARGHQQALARHVQLLDAQRPGAARHERRREREAAELQEGPPVVCHARIIKPQIGQIHDAAASVT